MITSMIRTMIRPMVSSMIPSDVESRVFIDLDEILDSHYVYSSALDFESGDTFEYKVVLPSATVPASQFLTAGVNGTTDAGFLFLRDSGLFQFSSSLMTVELDGASITSGVTTYPVDGKQHILKYTFTGNADIKFIGALGAATEHFDGIISDPVSVISGVTESFRLDEPTANFELPVENVFGSEEWGSENYANANSGTVVVIGSGSEWDVSSTTFGASNFTHGGIINPFSGLTTGKSYEYSVDSDIDINVAVLDAGFSLVASGVNSLVFTATATNRIYVCPRVAGNTRVSNASIKQVTNALTYVNIPESIRDTYTLVDDGVNWIGSELVVNGGFDGDLSGWNAATNWAYNTGTALHTAGTVNSMVQSNRVTVGNTYRHLFTSLDSTAGTIRQRSGSGTSGATQSTNGTFSEDLTTSGNTELLISPSSDYDGAIDNVSVKRKIEIA